MIEYACKKNLEARRCLLCKCKKSLAVLWEPGLGPASSHGALLDFGPLVVRGGPQQSSGDAVSTQHLSILLRAS